jgi:hypothetical protein
MANCAACGTTILFGGSRQGDLRFCNDKCRAAGVVRVAAASVPDAVVAPRVWEIRNGRCPVCSGPGPVDIHLSYRVWSGLVVTTHSTRPNLCCARCATRARVKDALFSLAFGWWGFPWGLIWTPIQIGKNVMAIVRAEDAATPSQTLVEVVRLQMAAAAATTPPAASALAPR